MVHIDSYVSVSSRRDQISAGVTRYLRRYLRRYLQISADIFYLYGGSSRVKREGPLRALPEDP
jgi:hypothetical protein